MFSKRLGGVGTLFAAAALIVGGCGKGGEPGKKGQPGTGDQAKGKLKDRDSDPTGGGGHESNGWWCTPHGVPEHLCSLCLPDDVVKKKFKDTGDWCKIHERAQSQCFKCNPKLYEKYEAMYVAKFGKKPERPPKEEFEK
jgi:hypothetical protein